ncbi:MAG: aminotransferase, partial [Clostridia bacterium]|nr:aminotransferase [Clostridia bacterium]
FLAKMDCAAKDFRIFWDLAYFVHDLYEPVPLLNILSEAEKCGKADRVYVFASTSKITYAGSGVSMVASGKKTASVISERLKTKTIGYDKINQLRHLKYLKDPENVRAIMERHAAILRPKFEAVLARFDKDLPGTGCTYSRPKGGYFISLYTPEGKASRIHRLASEAGLKLTPPGSAFPYGKDPKDHHLRIAPSAISPEELEGALDILVSAILAACL